MSPEDVVCDYVDIALRLDRLLPGAVELPVVGRRVEAWSPAAVVRAAGRLAASLPDALGSDRRDFLRGQLTAIEWAARRLAGQDVPYVDEVLAAFGMRIRYGCEDIYRQAHRDIDALLAGPGTTAERLAAHRARDVIPRDLLPAALDAVSAALRGRSALRVPLPDQESVEYRIVDDAPWGALHQYLGQFRSRITVNAGARHRGAQLVQLLAHEAYPGHHVERCRKEAGLVAAGWHEHRMVLANSPQALIAEGAAELGLHAAVGPGWGPFAADVLGEVGLAFDGEVAERLDAATAPLAGVRQDAALLLHQDRASVAEVIAYLRRWLLVDESRAVQLVRFLRHPLWRIYTTAYAEGRPLVRAWFDAAPGAARFRRLLDEPLTPAVLRAEAAPVTRMGGGRTG
ncbi:DUF885 domain-containing protein [Pseudonocardia nigra]|uniref:DUF885 domain-containing protein n=1 Tax=Pseudonocardia nigra TaxID=1921578 RepID=UPI001C5F730B|nr:DUF885 domain-containing protein [Pseudonocardia nigra]